MKGKGLEQAHLVARNCAGVAGHDSGPWGSPGCASKLNVKFSQVHQAVRAPVSIYSSFWPAPGVSHVRCSA